MLVVGVLGLVVNVGSAFVLARAAHGNLNLRAAFWHLALDALGSLAVIVSAMGALAFDSRAARLDRVARSSPALIVFAAWRLLRDTTRVLLDAVPAEIDVAVVTDALGVEAGRRGRAPSARVDARFASARRCRPTSCSPAR